jgi:hypothetical protein
MSCKQAILNSCGRRTTISLQDNVSGNGNSNSNSKQQ